MRLAHIVSPSSIVLDGVSTTIWGGGASSLPSPQPGGLLPLVARSRNLRADRMMPRPAKPLFSSEGSPLSAAAAEVVWATPRTSSVPGTPPPYPHLLGMPFFFRGTPSPSACTTVSSPNCGEINWLLAQFRTLRSPPSLFLPLCIPFSGRCPPALRQYRVPS